ncbi:uncharacterized protein EV420DRAFT_420033 [Desarmillaria tabescens]|uniref:Fe2OG dioxygenase domain-containing protein n=1 Tax=Armillaria tabescens TaxID=1929756 RepID=A0AA39J1B0_ARMTA|nr:uncharacterized protein EV420DRAFT_420033 [Desarmillaria tabescens]KAK0434258.1 hypothetical protein EV420DRAFT_420033 [Desarmillaria tabescens]
MTEKPEHPAIEAVKNALKERTFSQGQVRVSSNELLLFYSKRQEEKAGAAHFLNLGDASEASLRDLCDACDAAGFGLGTQNTFDETYRKSKKLDTTQFSSNFDLRATNILDQVQADLVEGQDEIQKVLRSELYKLNVYGKGDFFKAHKDTPRAENMMGSLVIVFPTPHEGGSLVLRQDGQEWVFSAERMLAESTPETPVISYIAFYSDVEHEVLPLTSGVRVTLTYNLYLEDKLPAPESLLSITENPVTDHVKDALQNLLAASDFLPEGGMLGFGLRHQYPFATSTSSKGNVDEIYGNPNLDHPRNWGSRDSQKRAKEQLSQIVDFLKGSDASIFRACQGLSLEPTPHIIYRPRGYGAVYMLDHVIQNLDAQGELELDYLDTELQRLGTLISTTERWARPPRTHEGSEALPEIVWVTPLTTFNRMDSNYIRYGNEASMGYLYGDICLIVKVGKPGNRAT